MMDQMIERRQSLKEQYMPFALEAGGSTYPDVNTKQLQLFGDLLIWECIRICQEGSASQTTSSGAAEMIKQRFGLLTPNEALDRMVQDAQELGLYD